MGWTSYVASHYNKNGSVNRKAEVDERWTQHETENFPSITVLKSKMIGARWYGVIEVHDSKKNTTERFAEITLTSTDCSDGMNFGYKDLGSYYSGYEDFPISFLKLLDAPKNKEDAEWRENCIKTANRPKLSDLPIGTVIQWKSYDGTIKKAYKHEAGYQFKKPFWMDISNDFYVKKNHIPSNYEVVTE